jgi:hypothetical protein
MPVTFSPTVMLSGWVVVYAIRVFGYVFEIACCLVFAYWQQNPYWNVYPYSVRPL